MEMRKDGRSRYKAKTNSEPCWVVSIDMPRRFVDEFNSEKVPTYITKSKLIVKKLM